MSFLLCHSTHDLHQLKKAYLPHRRSPALSMYYNVYHPAVLHHCTPDWSLTSRALFVVLQGGQKNIFKKIEKGGF